MRYRILGVTQAADTQGNDLPLGGPRLRALLTALALRTTRTTSPETLIDEVWPDDPPHDAPAALQALVGRLRRALGRDAVASEPGGYRLDATPEDVDLFVFERLVREGRARLDDDPATAARTLREALSLWRGPALADLPDRAAAAARPESLRQEATRARVEADLCNGHAHDAVPELKELTGLHPYDEPLHALLIRALRDTGRRADALAAYETVRRALTDGLGTDPGPELRALHAELLTPRPAPAPAPASAPSPASASASASAAEAGGSVYGRGPAGTPVASTRGPAPASTHGSGPASTYGPAFAPSPAAGPRSSPPATVPMRVPVPPSPYAAVAPAEPEQSGNIRPRLNSFVGREPELDAIRSELHRARLVTLTGPGGSGKTRLAEEAAAGHPQAWLAELAPLDRPEAVPGAVVSALGLRETVLMTHEMTVQQDDPVALLVEYCAPRSQLLILDNCEHVIDAAAELAETLLTHCPGLTILATSREPLGVPGESVRPVEPLLPGPAHRLFLERAAAVGPGAGVTDDPAAVDEICRRLDGLPLAIELAAARLRMLTARQIADRLDDRFRLLTSGNRTALPRQQTLRAVVDWSWDLLDESERTVLREVSVFAGGWDLEAAEAVCSGPVAEAVGALVDKSLVVAAPCRRGAGGMRYRMLETIHEYAAERAAVTPELRTAAERRHRAWARALAEEADPLLRSADQLRWIQRLETDMDNIRAALHRSVVAADEPEAGALVLAMGWFWWLRNFRREGAAWTGRVVRLGAALDARRSPDAPTADAPTPAAAAPAAGARAEVPERPERAWPRRGTSGVIRTGDVTSPAGADNAPGPVGVRDVTDPVGAGDDTTGMSGARGISDDDPFGVRGTSDPFGAGFDPGPGPGLDLDSEAESDHPLHRLRTKLRLLQFFLAAELGQGPPMDERTVEYVTRLRNRLARGGPDAASFPGIIWPLIGFLIGSDDVRRSMEISLANCRVYGGDWEIGAALLFRVHVAVDTPGGMEGIDEYLAELGTVSRRVGDRWMRAQVCSAGGEAAMVRGRLQEAKGQYEEALRLAHEVGAYAESPFLIARLGEIAYREGDRAGALTALDEATAAADRYAVPDSRAFVLLMRSQMAIDDRDLTRARELCEAARAETRRGTPPPQFIAALNGIDALLTATESGPGPGLRGLAVALREAASERCAEAVLAALAERSAGVLSGIGDHARVVRVLAAASRWRGGHPRPMPECEVLERVEATALAGLGRAAYETERATGATLTPDDVRRELAEASAEAPATARP
ncbi:BTAD domain-containing putative transcriptional regulator [Streptomyces sp. Qhu-G9]|uniref:AfsR/SARP family transcriptional regulator n=1 Tax=Streptomyces sp. Qhu-G9 TaxID=3452799 RepID=UPI0022ABF565|nr:BTAD domain-containing putative transcriptional regulator [Streptomyces aurantiacus]WAU85894.1 BTAD domain-containing putative transcriptional regulator [Streptomyces aurantiacus]